MWDEALEHGIRGTKLMQHLFNALSRPVFGDRICPHCERQHPSVTVIPTTSCITTSNRF